MEKRQRSPNYPAISLREAVDRARALHHSIGQSAHDRDVVARGMGYSSLSGASATSISALKKYGLLEGRNDDIRISDRAMSILFAHSEDEKADALRAAALEPELFRELADKFPQDRINDELLRNYLVRNGFGVQAADGVISAYKETIEFVGGLRRGYDSPPSFGDEKMTPETQPPAATASPAVVHRPPPPGIVIDGQQRLLARYDFEGGGYVEVRATNSVDTPTALDMVETLISLKRMEIERKLARPNAAPIRSAADLVDERDDDA